MDFIKRDIYVNEKKFYSLEVALPKTNLLVIGNEKGFIMCGALNVEIYDTPKLASREVVCARVVGVKTILDLQNAKIDEVTKAAYNLGIEKGMDVIDALNLLS